MSLDVTDYRNLLAIVSVAQFNGIQSAAVGITLTNKLQLLIAAEEERSVKPANPARRSESRSDQPASDDDL